MASKFEDLRSRGEKALVVFVTAGDPPLDQFPMILSALQEGGADIIEVGIPFSDPIADGPVIQASSQRALDRGVTPTAVLDVLAKCKLEVPLVIMGYLNPWMRIGLRESVRRLRISGASGAIVSDLIPDEAADWISASRSCELDTIFLAAPTSSDERLDSVCEHTTGFVYAVSRTGVTGQSQAGTSEAEALVGRLRSRTELPICVGFGISTPSDVADVCRFADGAVMGSSIVTQLANEWNSGQGKDAFVARIRELKAGTRS